jgi:predicted site-specific integrase-resolvase
MATTNGAVPMTIAAQRLGISRERVLRWVLTGQLKGHQRDGRWYADADSVRIVMRERKVKDRQTGAP